MLGDSLVAPQQGWAWQQDLLGRGDMAAVGAADDDLQQNKSHEPWAEVDILV